MLLTRGSRIVGPVSKISLIMTLAGGKFNENIWNVGKTLLIANTYEIVHRCDCNKFIRRSKRARHSYGFTRIDTRRHTRMAHVQNLIINGGHSCPTRNFCYRYHQWDDILFNKGSMSRRLSTLYIYIRILFEFFWIVDEKLWIWWLIFNFLFLEI